MKKEIHLTKGKVAIIDDDDFDKISKFKWCAIKDGNVFYASGFYNGTIIRMHRLVISVNKYEIVDRINGNGLDNRKCNLRVCSPSENRMNSNAQKRNKSGFKGVSWSKTQCKWYAYIHINGKNKNLGGFNCIVNAAKAYNNAAEKYYGKYAKLNNLQGALS